MNLLKCPAPELNGLVWSPVESVFLERSGHASMYSNEKIPTVEVLNIYELGTVCRKKFLSTVFLFILLDSREILLQCWGLAQFIISSLVPFFPAPTTFLPRTVQFTSHTLLFSSFFSLPVLSSTQARS